MQLKFLFGSIRALPVGMDSQIGNVKLADALVFTRKTDVYQHSDMKKLILFSPDTGGFIRKFDKPETMELFGESISCRVRTDESMNELYATLISTGHWWKHQFKQFNKLKTIFVIMQPGYTPYSVDGSMEWTPTTHAEMYEIVEAEADAACGW